MMARSHAVTGLVTWLVVAPLLSANPLDPSCLVLALVGSLLPDIDHPSSWVGRRVWPVSAVVARIFGHRGFTHSALAALAVAVLLTRRGYSHASVGAVAVGYLSHLAADMLSPAGLRLAWPLRRTWAVPVYRTGTMSEAITLGGFCVLAGCLLLPDPAASRLLHAARLWLDGMRSRGW